MLAIQMRTIAAANPLARVPFVRNSLSIPSLFPANANANAIYFLVLSMCFTA